MKRSPNRRDFLKLAGLFSLGWALPRVISPSETHAIQSDGPNILVVVFDAWSAYHLAMFGYGRRTTPHLERLAERAIVYPQHHAGGNFTTPGTASLLTGTLPWTHRAMGFPNATVSPAFEDRNFFSAFADRYRFTYSHNPLANNIIQRFTPHIEDLTPRQRLFLESDFVVDALFQADEDIATVGWGRTIKTHEDGLSYSLYFSRIYEKYLERKFRDIRPDYPRGIPNINGDNFFRLEDGIDWLVRTVGSVPRPFAGYYHFLPPHNPYFTRRGFVNAFINDGFLPPDKPRHFFQEGVARERLLEKRQWYDEFILQVDSEFNRLYAYLEDSGFLESTWLVLTSDHGELFERGILAHSTPVLHEPVVRVPLFIFPPDRTDRLDVHVRTSAIDVLPSLLYIAGKRIPDWIEGRVLPGLMDGSAASQPDIWAVESEETGHEEPLREGTIMLIRDGHKLIYYFGYPELEGRELVELYDIEDDPEELIDLSNNRTGLKDELLSVVKERLSKENEPYE